MSEVLASIINHYKIKANTNFFGVFFSFWIICHSQGVISLLFTGQEYIMNKYEMLKNEYLYNYFFGFHPTDLDWYVRSILPFILTAFYIWVFTPYVINKIYKYEIKYKVDRKLIKVEEESRFLKERNRLEGRIVKMEQNKALKEEAQKRQIEAKPQLQWDRDYEELKQKGMLRKTLDDLKNIIYHRNGRIADNFGTIEVDIESLTICESYGLVERNANNSHFINITEKGWYFIRKSV